MNTIQAMIILNNGIRKYGAIINSDNEANIKFIPSAEIIKYNQNQFDSLIEYIPLDHIFSVDTFLK